MEATYTSRELCNYLKYKNIRNVSIRAAREGWQSRKRAGRGGGSEWLVDSMPEKTKAELVSAIAHANAEKLVDTADFSNISDRRRNAAYARAVIVRLANNYLMKHAMLSKTAALNEFCEQYNYGQLSATDELRSIIPSICRNSVKNWRNAEEKSGLLALAGKYGHRSGTGFFYSLPIQKFIQGLLYAQPEISGVLLHQAIVSRFGEEDAPALSSTQHWLQAWKRENRQLHTFMTAPDQWRSRFMSACGSAYERIVRINQRWEFDGTPSDLLLADGKRYNITGVIDVYTRRLMLHVTERASAHAVASLTRRALIEWGVPETAVTDNGKDYVANHMKQIFLALGVEHEILPPFSPQLKPAIERSFRTFSHHLLTLMPGYTGANVAERQRIRDRRTFAQRIMGQGEEIELELTRDDLQKFCDDWVNSVYAHHQHSGLNGKTPFQVASTHGHEIRKISNERALDILLLPMAEGSKGFRMVTKKGVCAGSRRFNAPELGGLEGQQVQVRFDDCDAGVAYLFDDDGNFICRAVDHEILGTSVQEIAVERRRRQKKAMQESQAVYREASKKANVKTIGKEIMEAKVKAAARKLTLPQPVTEYNTIGLQQMERAAMSRMGMPAMTQEEVKALQQQAAEAMKQDWKCPNTSYDRYKLFKQIMEMEERGEVVEERPRIWASNYARSMECIGMSAMQDMLDANGGKLPQAAIR